MRSVESKNGVNVTYPAGVLVREGAWQEMRGRITSRSICPSDLAESWAGWGDIGGGDKRYRATGHSHCGQEGGSPSTAIGYLLCLYCEVKQAKCFKHFPPNLQVTERYLCFLVIRSWFGLLLTDVQDGKLLVMATFVQSQGTMDLM